MAIVVLQPGPLTTVQDSGRFGYQALGMPVSGVMDHRAFAAANQLAGNKQKEAVLEFTLFGGSYRFTANTVIALTGADMSPAVNGIPCPMYRPVLIKEGEVLSLSMAKSGCRTYLAVRGGIDVPLVMGSRSTGLRCKIGGFQGRALRAGDILPVGVPQSDLSAADVASGQFSSGKILPCSPGETECTVPPKYCCLNSSEASQPVTIRVIEGPQADFFSEEALMVLYSAAYTVAPESDRMGCRLNGPVLPLTNGTDILSDGTVFGSIQITSAGLPIILMAERQTTGGYAKPATVCTADLPVTAQLRPGDTIRFQKISLAEAQALL